jgi:hypothetical protein
MSEELAKLYQETYQRLAPSFGFQPGAGRVVPWEKLPERDRRLLTAVADIIELNFFGGSAKDDESELPSEFWAENGYGHNTRKPFVALTYNGRKLAQMPPETAIELAHNLLAVAEASIGDAFLVEFMRDRVGIEMKEIAGLLVEFREWRDKREAPGGFPADE